LARFPERILLNDTVPLEIVVKAVKPSVRPSQYHTSMEIAMRQENKEIPIHIIVDTSKGLELQNKYYDTINVPVEVNDSKPILFKIKAKEEGLQTIELRFYQETTCIGDIKIETLVMYSSSPIFPRYSKEYKSKNIPFKINQAPDISLIIYEKDKSNLEYDILVSAYDMPMQKNRSDKISFQPRTKIL